MVNYKNLDYNYTKSGYKFQWLSSISKINWFGQCNDNGYTK